MVKLFIALVLAVIVACQSATAPVAVASVRVTPDTVVIVIGTNQQMSVQVRDPSGNLLPSAAVHWSSSDTLVVRVSQAGMATATGLGVTKVNASSGGVTGSAVVYASFLCPCVPSNTPGESGNNMSECSCRP